MKLRIYIFIFFVSCVHSRKDEINFFKLEHINVNISPEKIKDPHAILCAGENSIILLNGQTEKFFDLFDLTQGKCTSFGIKGRGPGEMLSAVSPSYDSVNETINSYDMMNGVYYSNSLSNIIIDQNISKSLFAVDRSNGWPIRFIPFDNSFFLSNGTFIQGRFGLFNNTGKLIKVFGDFPDLEFNKKMSNIQLAAGYNGMICSHPSKPLFVTVVPNSDLIEIYEKRGSEFLRLNSNYQPEYQPCFKVFRMGKHWSTSACNNSIVGLSGIAVSDMFIFSAFSKENLNDLLLGKISNPTILRVYDWKGKHRADLLLDFPIVLYAIKRVGRVHIIYAIVDSENNEINSYKMVKYEVKLK